MLRYTPIPGFSDKVSQELITVRLHALKEVKESMSKQCLIEPKNNYGGLVFRPGAGWPEDLPRDPPEIRNLKEAFRAVFSTQIEKCARNFRPERFTAAFRTFKKGYTFWVEWNNAWQDAQKAGQLRGPGFKIVEALEKIFKDMESYLHRVFDEMMRAEMEAIVRKSATQKDMEPSKNIKFKVIQGKLAMDCHWNRKTRHDVLCRFEEEKDDTTETELGAHKAAAAQPAGEANQPRENGVRPSEKEVEVCRAVLQSMIEVLRTRKNEISAEAFLEFPEFIPGELYWVRRLKRRMRLKYREHLGSLAMLIDDPFFHTTVEHSVFCAYVTNWSERFEETRSLYTPGPLERAENIYDLQRKLRKLDRHMSTFLTSYYNYKFTKRFRDLCNAEMEKNGLRDNTMWFQVRLREIYEEGKQHEHHLHIATDLPRNPAQSMVWDKRWDDIFSDYIDPDYDFDAEDDGDVEPVTVHELPHVFNGICTIKRDGKMEHQTLIEEEEPNGDEVIGIDDEDAPQEVAPEGGRRKRGRPRKEETAAKRRRLNNSGRDEALSDEPTRGRLPQVSDEERAPSSEFTELDDDVVEALNLANDNEATIVVDSGSASSSTQAFNSNGANNNAAGPSRKRQNAGTNGFTGDGSDDEPPPHKRSRKEPPADKDADDEDQPDPKDKGKGKEVDASGTVKRKRGRPLGSRNKPKFPPTANGVAPNLAVNGNNNMINSQISINPRRLMDPRAVPSGYLPPPNPVPGPDDIPDNAVLTTSDRSLNSSSVRMDLPPPPGVNIRERPQYVTPGPLAQAINHPRAIFPNQEVWRDIRYPFTFGPPRQRQEEQQQRQRQPGNQPHQAPQQPCTRISPSHAVDNSSVPPQAGSADNPIDLDSEQQPPPTSQKPTTNSPYQGTPNPSRADQSQAGPSSIVLPLSGAPQPRQQDQQQRLNRSSSHQPIIVPPPALPSQTGQSNTLPPRPSGQHQQQTMHTNPPPQGYADPSHNDPGLRRILKEQAAGGSSQAQFGMQQQSPSPRLAPHGPPWQQRGVRSPQAYSQVPSHGHFRGLMHHSQYYGQQTQYNTQYYAQQGEISQNTVATRQEQSQHYVCNQGSPVPQGIRHPLQLPPQDAFAQDLPSFPPPPYEAIQQFPPQQFQPLPDLPVEYQASQYPTAALNHPGFYNPPVENQRIMQSPIQQQRDLQQPTPPRSRNPSGDSQRPPPQTYGEQQSFYTEALQDTMQ